MQTSAACGQKRPAVHAGELDGARFSGVHVLVLLAACFVAKN
jgi:hypothetical protein